uniref:RING-type E3 ubiquitin transferase n=1 Tax=Anser brachyrhynchus TaxID=132585 RepID=A0A8B9BW12_9AVES
MDDPLQLVTSMAAALDTRCPICLDTWGSAAYTLPCFHQFCFPCIQRWAHSKPECPLCKSRLTSIVCVHFPFLQLCSSTQNIPSFLSFSSSFVQK